MKKILVTIIVILFLVGLIAPKIVGIQFEQGIQDTVSAINDTPGYQANVETIESSWFSTQSVLTVGIDFPHIEGLEDEPEVNMDIKLDLKGQHGPFIFSDGFNLAWLKFELETITQNLPDQIQLQDSEVIYKVNGVTGLSGTSSFTDNLSALTYNTPEGVVSFSGMQGSGELGANSFAYVSKSGLLNVNINDQISLDMKQLTIDVSAMASIKEIMNQGLYDSDSLISVELIEFNNQLDGTETRIDNASMQSTSTYNKQTDMGDVGVGLKISSIATSQYTMSDINTLLEIKNLRGSLIRAYQEVYNHTIENPDDYEQIDAKTEALVKTELLPQLKAEPELNISDFSGKINDSSFEGKLSSKLVGITELPEDPEDSSFWLKHTALDSHLTMEKEAGLFVVKQIVKSQLASNPNFLSLSQAEQDEILEQQTAPTLDALAAQGMVVVNDEGLEVTFSLLNGEAILNGNPIPLE